MLFREYPVKELQIFSQQAWAHSIVKWFQVFLTRIFLFTINHMFARSLKALIIPI